MKTLRILTILLGMICLSACGRTETVSTTEKQIPYSKPEEAIYREEMKPEVNDLIYRSNMERNAIFLDKTYENNKTNTMVSPLSLNFAIGMVAEGASGETRELLNNYLNSENYGSYVREYMKHTEELNEEYEVYEGTYKDVFEIANSVWINGAKVKPEYEKLVTDFYKAKIDSFDGKDAIGSADKINSWVDEKTHQMIPSIIRPDMIKPDTRSILVNTVYFESAWFEPWEINEDSEEKFTDINGNITEIPFLIGSTEMYYENEMATAFSYPYKNGLSFIGILPKEEGDFNVLDLNLEELLQNEISPATVTVMMPRLNFEMEAESIKEMLIDMGMEKVFSDTAEFDKIVEDSELHIDNIIQKCKLELDENGTKASAATAVMMLDNCAMMGTEFKDIILNRPFAFLIYDCEKEQVVFIGKVVSV